MIHAWPPRLDVSQADRLLLVFSDIEMGEGGPLDDFPHSDFLGELILAYNEGPAAKIAVDLVLNGDTFDLLKTSYLDEHPRHVSSDVALGKLLRVAGAHPKFFEAMRAFLSHSEAPRRVHFVVGNHDAEILFPEVQRTLRSLCGSESRVLFPGFAVDFGPVHIEHGSQADPLFRMEEDTPFVEHKGTRLLNLPWTTVALLDVAMPTLRPILYHHDRLKPKKAVFELLPEIKELIISTYWRYWTRDYWRDWWGRSDPVKKLSWTMLKELVTRFGSQDPEVSMGDHYEAQMMNSDQYRLTLIGHQHEPAWWSFGNRKVLRTGCFRNEYMLLDEGKTVEALPKVYAEVYMRGEQILRSHLVEVDGPPAPEGYLPDTIFDCLPQVRELMAEHSDERRDEAEQQKKQEALEAKSA